MAEKDEGREACHRVLYVLLTVEPTEKRTAVNIKYN